MLREPSPHATDGPATAAVGADVLADALTGIETALDALASVDPSTLPEGCVTDGVRRLARVGGRIDGVQARLVAAAEAAGVPERSGAPSTTSWLADATGRSHGQAARTKRLAGSIGTNPELAEGVATGRVGPDQAAAIASGLDRGTLDPKDAEDLLSSGATSLPPGAFSREAKRLEGRRHQRRLRQQEKAAHDARHLSFWRTDDGSLRVDGLLAPADGDRFETAIRSFVRPDGAEVPDEARRTMRQLRADALVDALEAGLAAGAAGDVGGVRPHVNVTVPVELLADLEDAEAAGATGLTEYGTVLSAAATKRLLCDATVRRVVVDAEGMPLDVGRATRTWPPAIRAAIATADGGCRCPGCDLPMSRTQIHHLTWWRNGGGTSVANGVALCNHGHDLVHVGGWDLRMDPATRACTWTSPSGDVTVTHPRGAAVPTPASSLPTPTPTPAPARPFRTVRPPKHATATRPTATRPKVPDPPSRTGAALTLPLGP